MSALLSQAEIDGLRAVAEGLQTLTAIQLRFDQGSTAEWSLSLDCDAIVLTYDGDSTNAISTFTAAIIQSSLEALGGLGTGNVLVTGEDDGPFVITLDGDLIHSEALLLEVTPMAGTADLDLVDAGGVIDSSGYLSVGSLAVQYVPPGYRYGLPKDSTLDYLKSVPLGTVKTSVDADIQAKDRLLISGRLFEVVAPLTPKSIEIRRKFLVREIQQPERVLYLAMQGDAYNGDGAVPDGLPDLVRVLPFPFIQDRPIDTIEERESGGTVIAKLKQIEVSEIGISYLSDANLPKLLYCLVLPSNITPSAASAQSGTYARYRFNGSPEYRNEGWAAFYPWRVGLVESKA